MLPDFRFCHHCNRVISNDWWHESDCPSLTPGLAISEPKFGDQYRLEMEEARRRGLGVWAR